MQPPHGKTFTLLHANIFHVFAESGGSSGSSAAGPVSVPWADADIDQLRSQNLLEKMLSAETVVGGPSSAEGHPSMKGRERGAKTPLLLAVKTGASGALPLLLGLKADPNLPVRIPPLLAHLKRRRGSPAACVLLIDAKAELSSKILDAALGKVDPFLVRHLPYLLEQLYYHRNYRLSPSEERALGFGGEGIVLGDAGGDQQDHGCGCMRRDLEQVSLQPVHSSKIRFFGFLGGWGDQESRGGGSVIIGKEERTVITGSPVEREGRIFRRKLGRNVHSSLNAENVSPSGQITQIGTLARNYDGSEKLTVQGIMTSATLRGGSPSPTSSPRRTETAALTGMVGRVQRELSPSRGNEGPSSGASSNGEEEFPAELEYRISDDGGYSMGAGDDVEEDTSFSEIIGVDCDKTSLSDSETDGRESNPERRRSPGSRVAEAQRHEIPEIAEVRKLSLTIATGFGGINPKPNEDGSVEDHSVSTAQEDSTALAGEGKIVGLRKVLSQEDNKVVRESPSGLVHGGPSTTPARGRSKERTPGAILHDAPSCPEEVLPRGVSNKERPPSLSHKSASDRSVDLSESDGGDGGSRADESPGTGDAKTAAEQTAATSATTRPTAPYLSAVIFCVLFRLCHTIAFSSVQTKLEAIQLCLRYIPSLKKLPADCFRVDYYFGKGKFGRAVGYALDVRNRHLVEKEEKELDVRNRHLVEKEEKEQAAVLMAEQAEHAAGGEGLFIYPGKTGQEIPGTTRPRNVYDSSELLYAVLRSPHTHSPEGSQGGKASGDRKLLTKAALFLMEKGASVNQV